MKYLAVVMMAASAVSAQTPAVKPAVPPQAKLEVKPEAKPAPAVPVELKEKFFKAQLEALEAQDAAKLAQDEEKAKLDLFQATVKKAQEACGSEHQLSLDKERELTCVEKPKPAEPKPEPAKK
jgi:hypothetical protein